MKFRKLPDVVDAEQFQPDVLPWPDGVVETLPNVDHEGPHTSHCQWALTYEGRPTVDVRPGDWIITDRRGKKYALRADIFASEYEAV